MASQTYAKSVNRNTSPEMNNLHKLKDMIMCDAMRNPNNNKVIDQMHAIQ